MCNVDYINEVLVFSWYFNCRYQVNIKIYTDN